jgi:hypothetical protein
MIGAYKAFNKSLSDKYDSPGRAFVKTAAKLKWNVEAQDYDKYKVDLICYRDGRHIGYAEVEVREPYGQGDFPFKTVHVPARKDKLLNNGLPTVYFVVNRLFTKLMWVRTENIQNFLPIEVPNKMVSQGECFYDVPKGMFTEVHVND